MNSDNGKTSPETVLVSAGRPEGTGQPLNAPIVPASNFRLGAGKVYSREDSTPSWNALESIMGALEGGQATAFSSGMAAAAAVFEQVPAQGRVVIPEDCYQGVATLAKQGAEAGRWSLERLPTDDTQAWCDAAADSDLLWLETPSNPLLLLADLERIAGADRKPGALLTVDNTFATPLNQRPLEMGADLSMHSATKYIGGHSDLLGGMVIAGSNSHHEALVHTRKIQGATPGVLEAWLATRGLRTLAVRLERAQENAIELASFLESHPGATNVRYPGLSSHPQHELARRQMDGFGGIITFEVVGDVAATDAVCAATKIIQHATSLGSVESTMERRAAHGGQDHLSDSLVRISVGIEAVDDLKADLAQALDMHAAR